MSSNPVTAWIFLYFSYFSSYSKIIFHFSNLDVFCGEDFILYQDWVVKIIWSLSIFRLTSYQGHMYSRNKCVAQMSDSLLWIKFSVIYSYNVVLTRKSWRLVNRLPHKLPWRSSYNRSLFRYLVDKTVYWIFCFHHFQAQTFLNSMFPIIRLREGNFKPTQKRSFLGLPSTTIPWTSTPKNEKRKDLRARKMSELQNINRSILISGKWACIIWAKNFQMVLGFKDIDKT